MTKKIKPRTILLAFIVLVFTIATIAIDHTYSGFNKTAQVLSIKGLQHGIVTFYEQYKFFPGDFPKASSDLSLCTGCFNGNGNGKIDADEEKIFWQHLQAVQIVINQFDGSGILGGRIYPFYYDGKTPLPFNNGQDLAEGHYLILSDGKKAHDNQPLLSADLAERIDLKFDDGLPLSGDVRAFGLPECIKNSENGTIAYNSLNKKRCAFLYFRFKEIS